MTDPLGLISNIAATNRHTPIGPRQGGAEQGAGGPGFKELLQRQIDQVNQLQEDANMAMQDLATGKRDDLESVITATQKADMAFRMLLQVRNKVMDAYEEVKQIRV